MPRDITSSPAADDDALLVSLDRRYRQPLIRYFEKRIREAYDVDDLVQEVFIRLAHRAELNDIEQIEGYVFQTAANVMRDRARRRATRHAAEHEEIREEAPLTDDISPERVLLSEEELNLVVAALEELPARTRHAFVLNRYEGMRHEEIAAHLRITVSGVRFHLQRAKAHLAQRLERSE